MFGNCETGRTKYVMPPTIVMMIAMTIATMGRLMKNFAMALYLSRGGSVAVGGDGLAAAGGGGGGVHGLATTGAPLRTFCNPSTITVSPGLTPEVTNHMEPIVSPILIGRISA